MEKKPGPVDREKLMAGLQICGNENVGCKGCPYDGSVCCVIRISKDALTYINYLEQLAEKADAAGI